jgi:hypothetical protein
MEEELPCPLFVVLTASTGHGVEPSGHGYSVLTLGSRVPSALGFRASSQNDVPQQRVRAMLRSCRKTRRRPPCVSAREGGKFAKVQLRTTAPPLDGGGLGSSMEPRVSVPKAAPSKTGYPTKRYVFFRFKTPATQGKLFARSQQESSPTGNPSCRS